MFNTPLLADVAEWIVPLVVVAVYVISHLWNAIKSSQQQAPQRRSQSERPLQPQPADQRGANPASPQASGQGKLNAEIEQFLKRANERRGEKPGRQQPARQQPARQQSPAKASLPSEKKAKAPQNAAPRRGFDSVAESVEQHLGSRTFDQREQRLADDVVRAEQQLVQHVEQAFTHRLGALGPGETAAPPIDAAAAPASDSASMARAVAGLLVNQQSLRQAVLLKEILERPTDRW